MTATLYWLQSGGCSGDTMSLLGAESPDFVEAVDVLDLEILSHPSMSNDSASEHAELREELLSGDRTLDILCVEGAVITGPDGTGGYDMLDGVPKSALIAGLAPRAGYVVAMGTCAAFGGLTAECEVDACGLQFTRDDKGGFLGDAFTARSGLPVVNLPGCPCHPDVMIGALTALMRGDTLTLNEYNVPLEWYNTLVHQGCTRNEYHEYRVEETDFCQRGCLYFHMGCQGPLTYAPCNKTLWNRRSSKTRMGVPCVGCTRPTFPQSFPFFTTRNIGDIPLDLPNGVQRAHYMAYKGMAAAAAPQRLTDRETGV